MDENFGVQNVDLGNLTSRQIGNLMSKTLVERGKEVAKELNPHVDYGDLPSRALTNLGKESLHEQGLI